MNNTDLVRTALQELAAAADQPTGRRLEIIAGWRPRIESEGDALSRAIFVLAEASMRATHRPPEDVMSELQRAIEVFRINDRPRQQAEALFVLGDWKLMFSQPIDALDCARRALQIPEMPPLLRLRLMAVVIPSLTMLSCIDQAWDCYRLMFEPFMAVAPPSEELAYAHLAVANLLIMRAMKLARLRCIGNMADAQAVPSLQVRSPEVKAALRQARQQLSAALGSGARHIDGSVAGLAGSISALEGRLDEACSNIGLQPSTGIREALRLELLGWAHRINGHYVQALAYLEPALAMATELQANSLVGATSLECAICHAETGDSARAASAYAVCLSYHAAMTANQFSAEWMNLPMQDTTGAGRARAASGQRAAPPESMLRAEPPHLRRALRLMQENLARRLSLGELAERSRVRPRTLQASFRSYRDSTVVEAYRDIAMQHAKGLLLATSQPLSVIAAQSGHASLASFSRDFKQVFGLPPGQFRAHRSG